MKQKKILIVISLVIILTLTVAVWRFRIWRENRIRWARLIPTEDGEIVIKISSELFDILDDDDPTNDAQAIDEAIKKYKEVIERNPKCAEAYAKLGRAYSYKDMNDEAIEELKKAIDLDPRNVSAYRRLAICYEDKGEYEKAKRAWKKSLKLTPKNPLAKYKLKTWDQKTKQREAKELLDKLVRIDEMSIEEQKALLPMLKKIPKDHLLYSSVQATIEAIEFVSKETEKE